MPAKVKAVTPKKRCGLCGSSKKRLGKTDCCGNWICDDESDYELFSYARNSCSRNHRRFTLCGWHAGEGHSGKWQDCAKCRKDFDAETCAYYGTNEYNFEKLENPPKFELKRCVTCGTKIKRSEETYSQLGDEFFCEPCTHVNLGDQMSAQ